MHYTADFIKREENEEVVVTLRNDGIIHVHIKDEVEITREVQERMLKIYWSVSDIKRPFIYTGGEFITITKDARKNALKIEENSPLLVTAIVIKNLAQKIIADYYYKINKPIQPLKVFREFDKGIEWLLIQMEK